MRYIGGKAKNGLAVRIADIIRSYFPNEIVYEPFCGGLSCTIELRSAVAADACKPLIVMYNAIVNGWLPPEIVDESTWLRIRKQNDQEDPMHAFCAIGCTYSGTWWGSYARGTNGNHKPTDKTYAQSARSSLIKKFTRLWRNGGFPQFVCRDYRETNCVAGNVLYCDPPYLGAEQGYLSKTFDTLSFWEWCWQQACRGMHVFVSEFQSPNGVPCVAEFASKTQMSKTSKPTTERLYYLGPHNQLSRGLLTL